MSVTAVVVTELAARKWLQVNVTVNSLTVAGLVVERSLDGGVLWAPVRGDHPDDGHYCTLVGLTTTVYDAEAPLGVPVLIRVAQATPAGATAGSPIEAAAAVTIDDSDHRWAVGSAQRPSAQAFCRMLEGGSGATRSRSGVFDVLGRREPVVVLGQRSGRAGTLRVRAMTDAERDSLEDVWGLDEVLVVRAPSTHGWRALHIATGDIEPERLTQRMGGPWALDVPWTEVAAPTAPLSGWGMTYAQLTATGLTYDQLAVLYPTYEDMTRAAG